MKKIEKDYKKDYGEIPKENTDRIQYMIESFNLSSKHVTDIFKKIKEINSIKWRTISFIIYLDPKATPRAKSRNTPKGPIFYVKGASINKDIFYEFFIKNTLPMITTGCKFRCINYLKTPSTMSKAEKIIAELGFIRPLITPDWDNLAKTYSDMIQGTLLFDDALIIEGNSKKFYSIKPRIEVTIEYMLDYDSRYNEKKIQKRLKK